jgi:hypothetical protein
VAAESYLGFHVGGNAIAERGTVPPKADDAQNTLIHGDAPTLQNERAMDVAVRADDKTYVYIHVIVVNVQQGVGRKQGLRRPDTAAFRQGERLRNGRKL